MNSFIVFALLVCGAYAATEIKFIPVLERTETHDAAGNYDLVYRSADGTVLKSVGYLVPTADHKDQVLALKGEYSFVGDDGKTYRTAYIADDKGFRAEGEHLPKSVVA